MRQIKNRMKAFTPQKTFASNGGFEAFGDDDIESATFEFEFKILLNSISCLSVGSKGCSWLVMVKYEMYVTQNAVLSA